MSEQKALYLTEKFGAFAMGTAPIYKPGPEEVLVRVEAAGLNPADWGIQAYGIIVEEYPAVLGIDIAGTVVELGEKVTRLKKGDRVLTGGKIGQNDHAGFQQYTLAYDFVTAKIPDEMSFDEAATLAVGLSTAVVALYHDGVDVIGGTRGLIRPGRKPVVASIRANPYSYWAERVPSAKQLLNLSGFSPIISTASLKNADWLKQLGATHVIDRKLLSEEIRAEIKRITSKFFTTVFDAAGLPETQNLGYDLLASGGIMAAVRPDAIQPEKKVEDKKSFFMFGDVSIPQNRKLGTSFFSKLTEMLGRGDLKPNHIEVVPEGLEGIVPALEKLKVGVSCVKLVAHPQETA